MDPAVRDPNVVEAPSNGKPKNKIKKYPPPHIFSLSFFSPGMRYNKML